MPGTKNAKKLNLAEVTAIGIGGMVGGGGHQGSRDLAVWATQFWGISYTVAGPPASPNGES